MSEEKSVLAGSGSLFHNVDDTLTEKGGANIVAIWFLEQLVPVASSLCYSRKFKIFCIYDNKAKNKFITPYKIS